MYTLDILTDVEGQKETFRMCGVELPEKCVTQDYAGGSVTVCNCDTDNCNKDNQCDCSSSTGLKCQQCDGDGGECSSPTDNGQSVTCNKDQDGCQYVEWLSKSLKDLISYLC